MFKRILLLMVLALLFAGMDSSRANAQSEMLYFPQEGRAYESLGHQWIRFPYIPEDANNVFNAKVALKAAYGMVVQPGDRFSFNQRLGRRTEAKGYISGKLILGDWGIGGGVCRASTVIFAAAKRAGMIIIERHPHEPKKVPYVPEGWDAMVDYDAGYDMIFENPYPFSIKIITNSMDLPEGTVIEAWIVRI